MMFVSGWHENNSVVYQLFFCFFCMKRKKGERVDWMYAAAGGNQVDHELYLLGKPVDKAVDPMAQENEEVHFFQLVFIMKIVVR